MKEKNKNVNDLNKHAVHVDLFDKNFQHHNSFSI